MPLDYTRFGSLHLRRRLTTGGRSYKNTTVHSYPEGYFHVEACDYPLKGSKTFAFWERDYSFTMTTPSVSLWSLAIGATCLRPYNLHGDNVKTVTTTCLEQQPLLEMEKLDPQQHKCSELL